MRITLWRNVRHLVERVRVGPAEMAEGLAAAVPGSDPRKRWNRRSGPQFSIARAITRPARGDRCPSS